MEIRLEEPQTVPLDTHESLHGHLADALPKDATFIIHHVSTPPSRSTAIYSAPPNARPDRTYCESHFLTVSISTDTTTADSSIASCVLVFAIEILIYSTTHSTTFFVSKADSTGYLPLLKLQRGTASPIKTVSSIFLDHLVQHRQRAGLRNIISLFARAQDQYLFPGSIENKEKHVLDDRGLIRWWCRVLDPLTGDSSACWESVKGHLIVPGLDEYETGTYFPPCPGGKAEQRKRWSHGDPLQEISRYGENGPPRCLVPHFPDDPKSRYLDELDEELSNAKEGAESGQWKSIRTLAQFWDTMAFRQECSAGRLVGFLWIVFTPKDLLQPNHPVQDGSQHSVRGMVSGTQEDSKDDKEHPLPVLNQFASSIEAPATISSSLPRPPSSQSQGASLPSSQQSHVSRTSTSSKNRKLSGPVTPRKPRIKTQLKHYTLDRPASTAYYMWPATSRGQVLIDEKDYKRVMELLLRLDFANLDVAKASTKRWTDEVRIVAGGASSTAWGRTVVGRKAVEVRKETVVGTGGVNTMNVGLVRKKRKLDVGTSIDTVVEVQDSQTPAVNVLATGIVRRKPKI